MLQITCLVKNGIKHYIFNLLKLFIFTMETNVRTTPDNSSYVTSIPLYAEGNLPSKQNISFWRHYLFLVSEF